MNVGLKNTKRRIVERESERERDIDLGGSSEDLEIPDLVFTSFFILLVTDYFFPFFFKFSFVFSLKRQLLLGFFISTSLLFSLSLSSLQLSLLRISISEFSICFCNQSLFCSLIRDFHFSLFK